MLARICLCKQALPAKFSNKLLGGSRGVEMAARAPVLTLLLRLYDGGCLDICCRAGLVLHGLPHVLISVARGGSGSLLLGFGGKVSTTLHVCLVVHDSVLMRCILVSNRVLGGLAIHILHESRRTVGYASLFHRIPARRSTYLCLLAGRSSLDSPAVVLNLPHLVLV